MKQNLLPFIRKLKYSYLYFNARSCITNKKLISHYPYTTVYIIGCGRSGTSLLGNLLSSHNEITYLFEPYYIWSAIDPRLDVLNLFQTIDASLILDNGFFFENHRHFFERCVECFKISQDAEILLEKTPLNAFRIGWLTEVTPNAKFLHIVRDGLEVCTSIENLAVTNSYKIAGKPNLNQWWGNNNSKWNALRRDGATAGYFPLEVISLKSHITKAAYEWLLSLIEIDRWRNTLGNSLYEITYHELISQPYKTLLSVSEFLGIRATSYWLEQSITKIKPTPVSEYKTLSLPKEMSKTFNQYQGRYGFLNRAKSEAQ